VLELATKDGVKATIKPSLAIETFKGDWRIGLKR